MSCILTEFYSIIMKRLLSSAAKQVKKARRGTPPPPAAPRSNSSEPKPAANTGRQPPAATGLVHNGWTELGQEARVGYWPAKLAGLSQAAMETLLDDLHWQQVCWWLGDDYQAMSSRPCKLSISAPAALPVLQRDLVIFGRTVAQPRLICYMADPDTPPYTYSGLTLQPTPWAEVRHEQLGRGGAGRTPSVLQ